MGCGGSKGSQEAQSGAAGGQRRQRPQGNTHQDAPPQRKGSGVVGESGALSPGRQPQVVQDEAALKISVNSLDEARLVAANLAEPTAPEPAPEQVDPDLDTEPGPLKKRPGLTDSAENFFERLDTMVEGEARPA